MRQRLRATIKSASAPQTPFGAFGREAARPRQAVLAANPRDAEITLGLLSVEPVKHTVDAEIVHPAHHFPNGWVRRFVHLPFLVWKSFLVRRNGLHVVVLIIGVRRVIVFVIDYLRNAIFVEHDYRTVAVVALGVGMSFQIFGLIFRVKAVRMMMLMFAHRILLFFCLT